MKNTKLIWRLKEQPTSESLRELVKDKILTNEEAREILFSSEVVEERDSNSLKNEIKFLRDLVEKLSQNRSQIVEIIKEVRNPIYIRDHWYKPYEIWCGDLITTGTYTVGVGVNTVANSNFSSISTF